MAVLAEAEKVGGAEQWERGGGAVWGWDSLKKPDKPVLLVQGGEICGSLTLVNLKARQTTILKKLLFFSFGTYSLFRECLPTSSLFIIYRH